MAVIPLKSFTGAIPKTPAHLLPDNAAQSALDCDFAYGELKGLKDKTAFRTLSAAIGSLYTEDGSNFYTWPGQVETATSPVIGDIHRRLYYTVNDGVDIRVVAKAGTYAQAPTSNGITPTGYKVGVPGPSDALFGVPSSGELHARLTNYDSAATDLNINGYLWTPAFKGLILKIKFFYEHAGDKYQEVELINTDGTYRVYDGAYATIAGLSAPYCALQPSAPYSDGSGTYKRIYGRDFHVAIPAKSFTEIEQTVTSTRIVMTAVDGGEIPISTQVTEAVLTKKATPAEAKPILHITGLVDSTQVFSIYSEGSGFASVRGTSGAKLFTNTSTDGLTLYCGLKYGVRETRAYVYTHVNIFGEESVPSNPVTVDLGYGQTVELYGTFTQPCAVNDYAPIEKLRTYGTNTTSQGNTDWYFVSEGRIVTGLVTQCVALPFAGAQPKNPAEYGERISSIDYTLPPAGATGICALPNGILACHVDTDQGTSTPGKGQNEVWFSEPYHPNAWPSKYVISFPWAVVGIKPQSNGLLVVTKGHPYFVYGTHPESMTSMKLPALQAGISKRAMVDVGPFVIYASNDGLVAVSNTDVNLELSQRFFTRDTWRSLVGSNLSSLALAHHDGYLIGYFTNGAQGFVIRMDEAAGTFTSAAITASCHFVSAETDQLLTASGAALSSFGAGARKAYAWQSKDFVLPAPTVMGAGQIILDDSESGAIEIKVYADGALKSTTSMSASGYFRLPSGFMARRWSVKVSGSRTVKELYIAGSMGELARV